MQKALIDLGASRQEMGAASFKAGTITANALKGIMTPYKKTGKLLSTVKAMKMGTKVVVKVGNNTTTKYAGLQNFGSKRKGVEGRYFMQMAIRRTRQLVLDTYLDELQKLVKKYERKANK
jgi:hypothetical protein